jgi:hypothetical protein
MTNEEFLRLLAALEFPVKYWALCERFPLVQGSSFSGTKQEVLSAFQAAGVAARYDSRDRSYEVEAETIGSVKWSALFAKQRSGPDFMMTGVGPEGRIGSNFAVLAYEAKLLEDPSFTRSPFSGSPPYPRPAVSNSAHLAKLLQEFLGLVTEIKGSLRARENAV